MKQKLTQDYLKTILEYNSITGIWRWKISPKIGIKDGAIAGCICNIGYRDIGINDKSYRSSRLAFLYQEGFLPVGFEVDHVNRIRDDDRWKNLRLVSHRCNMRNCKLSKNNNSGVAGVYWAKNAKKWCATIMIDKKSNYLGLFTNFNDAVKARLKAEVDNNWSYCNTTSSAYLYLPKECSSGKALRISFGGK